MYTEDAPPIPGRTLKNFHTVYAHMCKRVINVLYEISTCWLSLRFRQRAVRVGP